MYCFSNRAAEAQLGVSFDITWVQPNLLLTLNTTGTDIILLAVLMNLSLVVQQASEEGRAAGTHQGTAEGED